MPRKSTNGQLMKLDSKQEIDFTGSVPIENRVSLNEIAMQERPMASLLVKRCLDFAGSLSLILLLSPLLVLVAIVIVLALVLGGSKSSGLPKNHAAVGSLANGLPGASDVANEFKGIPQTARRSGGRSRRSR